MKRCPFCAEEIQDAAVVCRFCNRSLVADVPAASVTTQGVGTATAMAPASKSIPKWAIAAGAIGVLLAAAWGGEPLGGFGTLLMWFGLAVILTGSMFKRVVGGLVLALLIGGALITVRNQTRTVSPPSAGVADGNLSSPSVSSPPPAPTEPAAPALAFLSSRGYTDQFGFAYVEGQVRNLSDVAQNVMVSVTWYTKDDQFITSDQGFLTINPLQPGEVSPFKTMSNTEGRPPLAKYEVSFNSILGGSVNHRDDRKR